MDAPDTTIFTFPGPDFHVELSTLDARMPGVYSRRLLIFQLPDNSEAHTHALEALKRGLHSLVQRVPPLAGTGVILADEVGKQCGRRTMIPGPGLQLIVKNATAELAYKQLEKQSFPMRELRDELLMPVGTAMIMDGPFPVAKMQVTLIAGGLILGMAVSHILADGGSLNTLTQVLAQETRRSQQSQPEPNDPFPPILGIDKSTILSLQNANPPPDNESISNHVAYKLNPNPADLTNEQRNERRLAFLNARLPVGSEFRTYALSEAALVALKKAASPPAPARISTHDAIVALLWRSILLARHAHGIPSNTASGSSDDPTAMPTTAYVPTNARRHFQVQDTYVGNAVYHTKSSLPLSTLLLPASSSLPAMALSIRAAISAIDPKLTASFVALAAAQPHTSMLSWRGVVGDGNTTAIMFVTFFSQYRQLYGEDWGPALGKVQRFRCPSEGFFPGSNLACGILPRLLGGGGEIVVNERHEVLDWMEKDDTWVNYCTRIG